MIFKVTGTVIKGLGIAKTLGFPTLNLSLRVVPKNLRFGVYAAVAKIGKRNFGGVVFYGKRSLHQNRKVFEIHCFGLSKNFRIKKLTVVIGKCIRGQRKFKSGVLLKKAIKRDIRLAESCIQKLYKEF